MSTIEQLHIGLVKAIKKGFLPTYLVQEVSWEGGTVVLQTRHPNSTKLRGPAVSIPAPSRETLREVMDALSEGVWYSAAARWTAAQALAGYTVWVQAQDTLRAVAFPVDGAFRIYGIQKFNCRQSLEFIRIFSRYSQVA